MKQLHTMTKLYNEKGYIQRQSYAMKEVTYNAMVTQERYIIK